MVVILGLHQVGLYVCVLVSILLGEQGLGLVKKFQLIAQPPKLRALKPAETWFPPLIFLNLLVVFLPIFHHCIGVFVFLLFLIHFYFLFFCQHQMCQLLEIYMCEKPQDGIGPLCYTN